MCAGDRRLRAVSGGLGQPDHAAGPGSQPATLAADTDFAPGLRLTSVR